MSDPNYDNDDTQAQRVCHNENCVRPSEPGERYCAACGLELSLFVRDLRPRRRGSENVIQATGELRRADSGPRGAEAPEARAERR